MILGLVLCTHQIINLPESGTRPRKEDPHPVFNWCPRSLLLAASLPARSGVNAGGGGVRKSAWQIIQLLSNLIYVAHLTAYNVFLEKRTILRIRSSLSIKCWG